MQWWCAASSTAWTWAWQPYPGVWLFMLLIAAAYGALVRSARAAGRSVGRARNAAFASGWILLWIVLDWPVGALGAGYLASVHMVQFLVLALIAPPLLVLGLPAPRPVHDEGARRAGILLHLTHPVMAIALFTAVTVATHLPVVTDRLMPSQLGAFVIDTLWLAAGVLFWWPVLRPAHAWFSTPLRIGYLFALMVLMTAPGAMITFSELPLYATYELAPPIPGVTPLADQRLAGIAMRFGGSLACWIAISVLFFRWARDEERLLRRSGLSG